MQSRYINADNLVGQLECVKCFQENPVARYIVQSVIDLVEDFEDSIQHGWIESTETPPLTVEEWDNDGIHYKVEKSQPLILLTDSGEVRTGCFIREKNGDFWLDDGGTTYSYNVVYWMPRPALPEGWKPRKEIRT